MWKQFDAYVPITGCSAIKYENFEKKVLTNKK